MAETVAVAGAGLKLVAGREAIPASLARSAVGGKVIARFARHTGTSLVVAGTMTKAITATGARDELIARRVVMVRRKASAAVGRNVKARVARVACAGLVVAGTVTKAVAAARAGFQRIARRVVVVGGQARAAIHSQVKASIAGITDTGLVVTCTVAVAVATAGAGLEFVARGETIPAGRASAAVGGKIIAGFARNAGTGLVVTGAVAEAGPVARTREKLVATRVIMVSGKACATVNCSVKSSLTLANTGCVIAQAVTTACIVSARNQLVAGRIAIPASNTRPAVGSKIVSRVARVTDTGLVIAESVAKAVAVAGARLKFVARWEAIPTSRAGTAVGRKIIAGFARNAGTGLVVTGTVPETGTVARASKELIA